jgi:RsiW-degrading membrane proteinase PrsW (M82 family)
MISQATIKEFQQVIQEKLGRPVDETEAHKILFGYVGYFDLLAKIDQRREILVS